MMDIHHYLVQCIALTGCTTISYQTLCLDSHGHGSVGVRFGITHSP
jgi:hypothetical protein